MVLSAQRVSSQHHLHSASVHPLSLEPINLAGRSEVDKKSPQTGQKRKPSEALIEAGPKTSKPDSFEKRAKTTPGKAATPALSHSGSDSSFQRFALALPDLVELPSLSSAEGKTMNLGLDFKQVTLDPDLQSLKSWELKCPSLAELFSDATSRQTAGKSTPLTPSSLTALEQVQSLLKSYNPNLTREYKQGLEKALLEFAETGNEDVQALSSKYIVNDSKLKPLIQRYKKTYR